MMIHDFNTNLIFTTANLSKNHDHDFHMDLIWPMIKTSRGNIISCNNDINPLFFPQDNKTMRTYLPHFCQEIDQKKENTNMPEVKAKGDLISHSLRWNCRKCIHRRRSRRSRQVKFGSARNRNQRGIYQTPLSLLPRREIERRARKEKRETRGVRWNRPRRFLPAKSSRVHPLSSAPAVQVATPVSRGMRVGRT